MNNTDTTSFESILAGVKQLRKQHGDTQTSQQTQVSPETSKEAKSSRSDSSIPVINSFNQQKETTGNLEEAKNGHKRKWQNTATGKTVLVSSSQKGNPLLDSLANTNWRYVSSSGGTKIYYDYMVQGRNVIFLSLKYHKLHPEYIFKKVQPLAKNQNNILLCVVDVENAEDILKDLNKLCMFNGFTLLLAFNFDQAGKYLMFMNK